MQTITDQQQIIGELRGRIDTLRISQNRVIHSLWCQIDDFIQKLRMHHHDNGVTAYQEDAGWDTC